MKAKSLGQNHFASVDEMVARLQPTDPVYCLRPHELERVARYFLDIFPGRVMYAVKCNPQLEILRSFYRAGIRHFDTASLAEIALIRENFPHADCYFMHPVKSRSAIATADSVYAMDHYVVDHMEELRKVVDVTNGGNGKVMLVRLATPQHDAMFKLSEKFGATPDEAVELLKRAEKEGFQTGLAFHVGSQCREVEAFKDALQLVGTVVAKAGVQLHYLDVGGGFPVDYVDEAPPALPEFIATIKKEVAKLPLRRDCTLMCEPGRALVASGVSLVVQVHLRKNDALYINDGIHHSMSEALTANLKMPMRVIRVDGPLSNAQGAFKIYGPTCDSTDVLPFTVDLPADIREGDWIEIGQAGAYTNSMASRFNGFSPETFVIVDDAPLYPPHLVAGRSQAGA